MPGIVLNYSHVLSLLILLLNLEMGTIIIVILRMRKLRHQMTLLILGGFSFLEKEMAPHSSTLAWKIPCTEEPGRLQSMGLQRVGHD